jgi:hypothetical protein
VGLVLVLALLGASACRRATPIATEGDRGPRRTDQGASPETAESRRLRRLGDEIEALVRAGKIPEAHRRALELGTPTTSRLQFFVGHLEQLVAEAMVRYDGPERPSRRFVLFVDERAEEGRDLCGPQSRSWLHAAVEHLHRFERYVPGRAHGRGGVIARIGEALVCGDDLPAARRDLERWSSPWARWQRAWYAFLAGDERSAAQQLSSAELERRIPGPALSASRLLLGLQLQPHPLADAARVLACRAPAPELVPWCALPEGRPLATAGLRTRLRLPAGARARLYLLPRSVWGAAAPPPWRRSSLGNPVVARDDSIVFRNLSFFHYRAAVPATGRVSVARLLPGRYALALKVWSDSLLRLARKLPQVSTVRGRTSILPEVEIVVAK